MESAFRQASYPVSFLCVCHSTELIKHLWKLRIHVFVGKLAGADLFMAAAMIFEHQASYIDLRGPVYNAVADCCGASLAAASASSEIRTESVLK